MKRELINSVETLLKPFPYEKKSGFKNISCFGGFDNYVKKWGNNLLLLNLPSHHKEWIKNITEEVNLYPQWYLEKRKKFIDKSYKLLLKIREELILENSIQYVKGVGPYLSSKLSKVDVFNVRDLLYHFPRKYEDRTNIRKINSLNVGENVSIKGKVNFIWEERTKRGKRILKSIVSDGTGKITLVWFSYRGIKKLLSLNREYIFTGKVSIFGEKCIIHPEFEEIGENTSFLNMGRIIPFYPSTEELSQRLWRKIIFKTLEEYSSFIYEVLPENIRKKYKLLPVKDAIREIHFPSSLYDLKRARLRFAWEELFIFELALYLKRGFFEKEKGKILKGNIENVLSDILPFSLTQSQKEAIEDIEKDLNSGKRMYRLLQGEVGSGKTVIALGATLLALKNNFQVSIMVPTLILAEQHYFNFLRYLSPFGYKVVLLTGREKGKRKEKIIKEIKGGKANVVIGTHSLIEEKIEFSSLGLVIIDEQHKFGVIQRSKLSFKGDTPHVLLMSATPIPRSLALALYGNMDISTLKEIPKGRGEIETYWVREEEKEKIYPFIREEISSGHLVYYVVPRIKSKKKEIESIESTFKKLKSVFPDIPIGILHGGLKKEEQKKVFEKFRKKETPLLLTTTVIEVGVDVPEATLMVIENASNFGLSELHQLRGRIGRGKYSSYCILVSNPKTEKGYKRLNTLLEKKDGFLIAEEDLKIRGPGDLLGIKQHGFFGFRIVNLLRSVSLLDKVRFEVEKFLKEPLSPALLEVIKERFPEWETI